MMQRPRPARPVSTMSPSSGAPSVTVLGAGIQGVLAALALRREGYGVTLVDQAPDCMSRTSLVNEGKIHLGHVYANDVSFKTSGLMLEAALRFAPLVERFVGHAVKWPALRSNPFTYIVSHDSLVGSAELCAHYERLEQQHAAMANRDDLHYLGERPAVLWRHAALPASFDRQRAIAAIETPEVSVDTAAFGQVLRAAVIRAGIQTCYGHTVAAVERTDRGFRIGGTTTAGVAWTRESELLINCLWAGRLAIDRQLGLLPARQRVYRLKHRLLVDVPERLTSLPSVTIVLGPFGDLVTYPQQRTAYVSWYPACMRDWSADVVVPPGWSNAVTGKVETEAARVIVRESLEAFDALIPGMAGCTNPRVGAGVIFAWGKTDIDDPASELHRRHDIGLTVDEGYISIDTGKFTTAPLFADRLVGLLRERR